MEYTSNLFVDFLDRIVFFDKEYKSILAKYDENIAERRKAEILDWSGVRNLLDSKARTFSINKDDLIGKNRRATEDILDQDIESKQHFFERLNECKAALTLISSIENRIVVKSKYETAANKKMMVSNMTLDEILISTEKFSDLAYDVNFAILTNNKKEIERKSIELYGMCRNAEEVLKTEISKCQNSIMENQENLHSSYYLKDNELESQIRSEYDKFLSMLNIMSASFTSKYYAIESETTKVLNYNKSETFKKINDLIKEFCEIFPPEKFIDEYTRIYSIEPSFSGYTCPEVMPRNVFISTLEFDINQLNLSEFTKEFIDKYYYFIHRDGKLIIPHCTNSNYIFNFNSESRLDVVEDACNIGMRLFMMIPPGKVNFMFIDPVTLGESFAMFTRLVDIDDRTSEIINGKIWSSQSDIEAKFEIMTNHISNVTQRCLQGKYNNIFEYNNVAEQNAEAYQFIMIMDYPAGLNERSCKLLEQIVTSGPKCGVFTMIYKNQSQYEKISERMYPLFNNIESNFEMINYSEGLIKKILKSTKNKDYQLIWKNASVPTPIQMECIIKTIKSGIKSADKVVIGIEKVNDAESTNTTRDGIRIPIGIHGANEVQYLTLGVGGSHHALIAGVAGSGKSSLLHTIILRTLMQYSPEELVIYLVDFKRGVEFKIYADFILPSFKVVAIESEREFGYNILLALEREQKIRADLFKKDHVDKIEEYRASGKAMPRILVIMDEFHELFSNSNDEFSKKSSLIMERIVRQGRAFGVHMILASQSYSNITGIDKAVFDQMAVRIVLKCSTADANLLLDNGSTEIDQISIDDPGRAVYNSEAGNREYNSHFRIAYIDPLKHRSMLQNISDSSKHFLDNRYPTRILLSNIEDNSYSIFNKFETIDFNSYDNIGRLYLGEPLSLTNNMTIDFSRMEYSNLMLIGGDTDKARNMFIFSILSLCINYKIKHQSSPKSPFIYLINCKPLNDTYFKDMLKVISEALPEYICYIKGEDSIEAKNIISKTCGYISDNSDSLMFDKYLFLFGYQRADLFKYDTPISQSNDIDSLFNIMPTFSSDSSLSTKEMFRTIIQRGSQNGIHTIIWQDSFNAFYQNQDDKDMLPCFSMKIAFDMTQEEYSRFIGENDVSMIGENNAIYHNRSQDNQKFRPYQSPQEEWLNDLCKKLK